MRHAHRPIGVLGLQGDFEAHRRALEEIGESARVVRTPEELGGVEGLVIPGGESTTLIKLMRDTDFVDPLRRFHGTGAALFGTCAGAILLAARVFRPEQFSLGFIDIDIERNAYGRQVDSFETQQGFLEPDERWPGPREGLRAERSMELVMIRAPRIRRCGPGVRVLVRLGEEPMLVRQGSVLAGTFHPELGRDRLVHRYFAEMARRTPAMA